MPFNTGDNPLRHFANQALILFEPAVPFFINGLASGAAFTTGLAATQFLGIACRVSCASPVLGPSMGIVGVGVASAMGGQAALHCQHHFKTGRHPLSLAPQAAFLRKDLLLDACMGIILYKMMGGRYRNVMPSDLFKRGALARGSLPAPGKRYASENFRDELRILMRRDGCHHCGKKQGRTVGDHIPPNKQVWGSSKDLTSQVQELMGTSRRKPLRTKPPGTSKNSLWLRVQRWLGFHPILPQRYYPQCTSCSNKQSQAVKMDKRTLVVHMAGPRPWHYAGVLVGMRYFHAPVSAGALLTNDLHSIRQSLQPDSWDDEDRRRRRR
ncbi:hypothetical protein ABBQ38_009997 [Trebouxia sp. C0009 RCD-2024]